MKNKSIDLNEDFFKNIQSEQQAYFLGLLFADGNVDKNGYNTTLTLKNTDREILEKFEQTICKNKVSSIKDRISSQKPYSTYSTFRINSKNIVKDLISLGCTPNKSLTLVYPQINNDKHFIRGYFDGDGSISIKTSKIFTITSTYDFCVKVKEIIENNTMANMQIYKYKNVYRLTSNGNIQVRKILSWLYSDSIIYMKRKKDIFDKLMCEKLKYISNTQIQEFIIKRNGGLTYQEIGDIYNYTEAAIRKSISKYNNGWRSSIDQ